MLKYARAGFDIAATFLMFIAATALLWRLYSAPTRQTAPQLIEELSGVTLAAAELSNARGSGRVVLIEFGDYECPFCARHQNDAGQRIAGQFVEPGLLQHAFLNFPLDAHAHATKAAEAAECAARQGRFWEMHRGLFADPKKLELTDLRERAKEIGLNEKDFATCLENNETAVVVRRDREEGRRLGVKGTPAFFLGVRRLDGTIDLKKKVNGALEFAEFEKVIRELVPIGRAKR